MGSDPIEVQETRTAITRLLLQHLTRLAANEDGDSPSLTRIESLTLLYLLHEREKEIAAGGSLSTERPTRESLLADLADIDPQAGSSASNHLDQLMADGLVMVDDGLVFILTPKAAEKVALYDATFPGMPGLSFVAYLLQTMQEVSSGRKPLTAALDQVDRTLRLQGRPQGIDRSIIVQGENGGPAKSRVQTTARLEQLYRLQQAAAGPTSHPKIITRSGCTAQVEVKSLFPRKNSGPPDEKSATAEGGIQTLATAEVEGAAKQAQSHSGGAPLAPVANEAGELPAGGEGEGRSRRQGGFGRPDGAGLTSDFGTSAVGDSPAEEASGPDQKSKPAGEAAAAPQADILGPAGRPTGFEVFAVGEPMAGAAAPETERATGGQAGAEGTLESNPPPSDVAKDVGKLPTESAAIEKEHTIECPICRTGSVRSAVTPKGKTYYACSQAGCNFISWGRPYPHPCPVCGNPFLVETSIRGQGVGLKCPRATCTFRQAHIKAPSPQTPPSRQQPNRAIPAGSGLRKVVRARRPV